MSKTLPPDTPQVQVEFETPYLKGTQKLDIQSNRSNPIEQFAWKWLNQLYPPANPTDFVLDAAAYILGGCLVSSIGQQMLWVVSNPVGAGILWALFTILALLAYLVCVEVKRGWLLLFYRGLLIVVGLFLGGLRHG